MSNRRTRSPRGRKPGPTVPPRSENVGEAAPPATGHTGAATTGPCDALAESPRGAPSDPTQTGQLRALEAGWDELIP